MAKPQYPCLVRLSEDTMKTIPAALADRTIAEDMLWAIKADSRDIMVCDRPDYVGRMCTCVPADGVTPIAPANAKSPTMTILVKTRVSDSTANTLPARRLLSVAVGDALTDYEVTDVIKRLSEMSGSSEMDGEPRIDALVELMSKHGPFIVKSLPEADGTVEI